MRVPNMAISPKMSDVYWGLKAFHEHSELSQWQKGQVTDSHALEFSLLESIQMLSFSLSLSLSLSFSLRQVTKDTLGDPHEALYISWKKMFERERERDREREHTLMLACIMSKFVVLECATDRKGDFIRSNPCQIICKYIPLPYWCCIYDKLLLKIIINILTQCTRSLEFVLNIL